MRVAKVLVVLLVCASTAGATVIDLVKVDIGKSGGRLGGLGEVLRYSDVIGIKIVLNHNPHPTYSSYDGYLLESIDLDLHVTGPASLGRVGSGPLPHNMGFDSWYNSEVTSTGVAHITGLAMNPIAGQADLVWGFTLHCDGPGAADVDLTLAGLSEYKPFADSPAWLAMTEADLGNLRVYLMPEPATVALLGLGGLALLRRRR